VCSYAFLESSVCWSEGEAQDSSCVLLLNQLIQYVAVRWVSLQATFSSIEQRGQFRVTQGFEDWRGLLGLHV